MTARAEGEWFPSGRGTYRAGATTSRRDAVDVANEGAAGMIYFIRSSDGKRVKIGTTVSLTARLKSLVAEYGAGLEVLAVVEGSYGEERGLHHRFSHLRLVGEWFEPGDDLMGFIVSDGTPWDGSDESTLKTLFAVKGTVTWYDWLRRYATSRGVGIMALIDSALRDDAIRNGFTEPMPKRGTR